MENKETSKDKLFKKYSFTIQDVDTFEVKSSFKLSRFNILLYSFLIGLMLILGTTFLISATFLREYIPGYPSTALKKKVKTLEETVIELEETVRLQEQQANSIKKVLKGEFDDDIKQNSIKKKNENSIDPEIKKIVKTDDNFRKKVEREDKYNIFETTTPKVNYVLQAPIKGSITNTFNSSISHYGVDIAVEKGSPVKSVADGIVISSEWSAESGNVIKIAHKDNLLSIYKHNQTLLKKQGNSVKAGEVIAHSGNSGKHTSGPHLHFELWIGGYSVSPTQFINFE